MTFNTTEIDSTPGIESFQPEVGYWDTVKASFENSLAVSLSDSKDKHYKEIMQNKSSQWTTDDPDNKDLYNRMSNYDIRDIEKMEALYEEGQLDNTYVQRNVFNADIFLVEDFLKFKEIKGGVTESINSEIKAKALNEYTESAKVMARSEHWSAKMLGGMGGAMTDIKTLQTLPLGTWTAGGTVAQNAGRAFLEEAGIETLAQMSIAPEVYSFKKELGIKTSVMQEAFTAATSIVTAGAVRGVASGVIDIVSPKLIKANMDLTPEGIAKLKEKDPELGADYESIAKSQTTEDLDEHAMNLQRVEFGEEVTEIRNPNEVGKKLNESEPIPEYVSPKVEVEKEVDLDAMQFVSGKDIDGNVETKSYKTVKDELEVEADYLRSVEKCLL